MFIFGRTITKLIFCFILNIIARVHDLSMMSLLFLISKTQLSHTYERQTSGSLNNLKSVGRTSSDKRKLRESKHSRKIRSNENLAFNSGSIRRSKLKKQKSVVASQESHHSAQNQQNGILKIQLEHNSIKFLLNIGFHRYWDATLEISSSNSDIDEAGDSSENEDFGINFNKYDTHCLSTYTMLETYEKTIPFHTVKFHAKV